MRMYFRYLMIIVLVASAEPVCGQTDEESPVTPVLNLVTVNQLTGNPELTWSLSPSPDVAGYVVYSYQDGEGYALDTLYNPTASSYTYYGSGASYFSEAFVVAAFDSSGNISPLSNELHTIFTEVRIDSCNNKINITWNSYPSQPIDVTGYTIFYSVNGGIYTEAGEVTENINNFVINEFTIDSEYCFFVNANLEDDFVSVSNKTCISTRMQRPPQWINADYATVIPDAGIVLTFTIDPLSEISLFLLERKTGVSSDFQQIAHLSSDNGKIEYTDNQADVRIINYYRLSAVNNCNIPVITSNISSNIVLSLERAADEIQLAWNSYKAWLGSVDSYTLYINTGSGFDDNIIILPGDTTKTIIYSDYMYKTTESEICFFVSALESSNPYDITGESRSNIACTEVTENITVPNVFTPDGDLVNDLFRPVLSFTPVYYNLVISDRHGRIVFETKDHTESWDGSYNGTAFPEGVCLWFLQVTTPSGKRMSRTGTLTVIKNR